MPYAPRTRLLVALFDLAQASESIDLYSLAEEAGLNLYRTLSELHSLSGAGLVDARRLRLTALGLPVAVSLAARAKTESASPVPVRAASRTAVARVDVSFRKRRGLSDASRQQAQATVRNLFERDLVA
jgi:hypothetical protein